MSAFEEIRGQDAEWVGENADETRRLVGAILERVDKVLRSKGWSEGYFGKIAGGDDGVVGRLRANGRITAKTIARIETFLREVEGVE